MINLTKGNTEIVYFTGTEKATLSNPYFLFIFTNTNTLEVIKVMGTNTSTTARYDKCSIVVNTYFTDKENGFWNYEIREKASSSDMAVTGTVVESGYMYLRPATPFTPTEYASQSNEFVTYNGQ